jgi:two-component system, OmpR family, phosphate regulon sensor histidine kinase PhoR
LATERRVVFVKPKLVEWRGVCSTCAVLLAVAMLLTASRTHAQSDPAPFSAVDVGSDTLVFTRHRATSGEVEGFVVDTRALVNTLKTRVLEARGLGEVAEVTDTEAAGSSRRSVAALNAGQHPYVLTHRFGPPFDSVTATLRLRPLEEPDESALLGRLGLLLALCVLGGLYAVYRMTATQVEFAERRGNFVSAVTHELKTPLTAIRMYAEMLEQGLVDDPNKQHEYHRTITSESERLSRLINNVLELSRIERRRNLPLREGDIRQVVREAVEVLRPHVEREGFALDLDIAEALPSVRYEPDALRQVLFNLIDNALKYGREAEEKRITIRCEGAEGGVRLVVRDRGPGVQAEHLQTIFEPFFRGERELVRKHPGTGIGLALVKGMVDGMHGHVSGHNTDGGFEVWVELTAG